MAFSFSKIVNIIMGFQYKMLSARVAATGLRLINVDPNADSSMSVFAYYARVVANGFQV